ncbi:hypothetical protein, partial [uncultured Campylobacter sp.]|uniref:hypothetical protein n=1 Tax=uncultured Campylobacter sp. TaxID=218934 RepID=UPI002624051C
GKRGTSLVRALSTPRADLILNLTYSFLRKILLCSAEFYLADGILFSKAEFCFTKRNSARL